METGQDMGKSTATTDIPHYVRSLALGIPAILLGIQLSGWIGFIPVITDGHFDFRQLYTAGYMVRSGHASELYVYDVQKAFQDALISREQIALPFNHLAYEALLYAPFSLLSWRKAYFAFLALQLALLAISFRFLRPCMGHLAELYRWLPPAMFLVFLPVAATLMQGQDSIVLLTLLSGAAASLDRGREFRAGILLGLALFKFQIVIPIALLFLVWRRWRFTAGFACSAATVGAVSLHLVGLVQAKVYGQSLVSMSVGLASRLDQFRYGISPIAMPNLRGLIFGLANTRFSPLWLQAATIAASVFLFLWVAVSAPKKQRGVDALLVAITASAVVSYHFLFHDMSILLIPIALTLNQFIAAEGKGDRDGRLLARVSALMFVAPICESFIPGHFYLVSLPLLALLWVLTQHARRGQRRPGPGKTRKCDAPIGEMLRCS